MSAHTQAVAALVERDPVMAGLVERYGPMPAPRRLPVAERFEHLAESILYQQLAGAAAAAIHGRFVKALGGIVSPQSVLATPLDVLTGAGLSRSKAAAIVDLAEKVWSGQVALERLGRLPDDQVTAELVQVRGIGPWTADMFLLFGLGRLDVWPVGDYGVRAGFARAWGLDALPSAKALGPLGDPFRPYRSIVAWYCWRAVEDRASS